MFLGGSKKPNDARGKSGRNWNGNEKEKGSENDKNEIERKGRKENGRNSGG